MMLIGDQVKIARSGAAAIRQWRQKHPRELLDLSGADLSRVNLCAADLRGADLSRAYLQGADLRGADLSEVFWPAGFVTFEAKVNPARLVNANLVGAALAGADMSGADLRAANLENADLRGANMTRATLAGANLTGVIYDGTTIWPKGFRPGLFVVKKLVVALDVDDAAPPEFPKEANPTSKIISKKNHLAQQLSELQSRYKTVSRRIAALDTDLGRALDNLSRQVLEEQRKEFAAQREEITAQMVRIEEQLGK